MSCTENLTYKVRDKETQEVLPFTKYVLTNELGHSYYGETDEDGLTKTIYSDKEETFSLHIFSNGEYLSSFNRPLLVKLFFTYWLQKLRLMFIGHQKKEILNIRLK